MLATLNRHANDDNIRFQADGHKYNVRGCESTISVTRLVHSQFSAFDADAVIAEMMARDNWSKSKYFGLSMAQIKEQWSANGAEASAAGTKLHNDIEDYYNGASVTNDSVEFKYFLEFDKWRAERGLVPYRAEWTVYDVDHLLAGTIDMCFMLPDGTIGIYDWKRVKQLRRTAYGGKIGLTEACASVPDSNYWHYSLQLGLYKWMLETNYGFTVSETALVALHPDQKSYEIHTTDDVSAVVGAVLSCRKGS